MEVALTKKRGFVALSAVVIYDGDGAPFHAVKEGRKFSLPAGTFNIYGNFIEGETLQQEIAIYPIERNDRPYDVVKIFVIKNPNKASVIFANNVCNIFLDEEIARLPKVCVDYAIEHEKAHAYYKRQPGETHEENERKCDAFAENILLELGYNPSQITVANTLLLKSGFRKNECTKRMNKHFKRHDNS